MRESASPRRMTFAQYMALEETSEVRHEFVRGEVFAMVGGTFRHNRITGNVFAKLKAAERGGPCHTIINDVKVRAGDDVIYYPDVAVECVPRGDDDLILEEPCVVVEVTSRSTRRVDRGEKLENYRRIPSLRAYLIIDQSRRRVSRYWRGPTGGWNAEELEGTGVITVPCPETTLALDEIYEGVELPLGVAEPVYGDAEAEYAGE